ncbi:Sperm-tail PG-rich repeat-containing protein 2 [Acipenser ruthenus]|uniref:Sperm-tail PG-rich repeat-containing protein 2 n=1 Tax=Acipenser ruthenus TaxID=7906 RepID=A0A444TWY7_ACIRT|nr:Sperm-tail PG-rich repeat-containing protein 2 [Acipenser ruthenus]
MSMSNRESIFHVPNAVVAAPGPGQYDAKPAKEHILGGKSIQNKSKRFGENIPDVPGPGSYNVSQSVKKSLQTRFAPVKSITPAPGSYNDPRTALQYLTKITGMKRSPFGLTAVRFIPESIKTKTPVPDQLTPLVELSEDDQKLLWLRFSGEGDPVNICLYHRQVFLDKYKHLIVPKWCADPTKSHKTQGLVKGIKVITLKQAEDLPMLKLIPGHKLCPRCVIRISDPKVQNQFKESKQEQSEQIQSTSGEESSASSSVSLIDEDALNEYLVSIGQSPVKRKVPV